MIVMKFGGSSIADAARIKKVADIIQKAQNSNPVVVVSAQGGVTDWLVKIADSALNDKVNIDKFRQHIMTIIKELEIEADEIVKIINELSVLLKGISLVKELTNRTLDYVLSFGERISARIISFYLQKIGIKSVYVDAYDLGIVTDSIYGNANVLTESYNIIQWNISRYVGIPIVTGFIGKDKSGNITTIGRNGSDLTAAIIGSAIDAEEIQIWSDVDGVMTADPTLIENAQPISEMSFNEASELAYYGGRLHPETLVPAVKKGIPIRVLNTFNPKNKGTKILDKHFTKKPVKSIVHKTNLLLLNIVSGRMLYHHGFMAKIFDIFGKYKIIVDMIATSEVSVSVTIDSAQDITQVIKELSEFSDVTLTKDKATVCVVGEGIKVTKGVVGRIFRALSDNAIDIEMISFGATKINIAFLINECDHKKAIKILHDEFFS